MRVTGIRHVDEVFEITTEKGEPFSAKTVLLTTGLKEILPPIDCLHDYYGKSLFSCPYCDGWELRDQPLIIISEQPHTFHFVKVIWNWSHDLLVCRNGQQVLTNEQHETLRQKGVEVVVVLLVPSCCRLPLWRRTRLRSESYGRKPHGPLRENDGSWGVCRW